jgi:hypothetical protein
MEDLTIAIGLMAFVSIGIFLLVRRLVRNASPIILDGIAAGLVILIGIYVRLVWGQLWIVKWIPFASVIVLSNWFPLILGALAGVLWARTDSQSFLRRLPIQLILIAGAIWSVIYVFPQTPPKCGNDWIPASEFVPYRICRQTTPYTCSAAAAATILVSLGIETTEEDMAALCLTKEGTTWLGLYHGLTVRLKGTNYKAEFFECSVGDLDSVIPEHPALLCCQLTDEVDQLVPEYSETKGWKPGVAHSTVLFAYQSGKYLLGDPSQPYPEVWNEDDMSNLWTGRGLRIVERID